MEERGGGRSEKCGESLRNRLLKFTIRQQGVATGSGVVVRVLDDPCVLLPGSEEISGVVKLGFAGAGLIRHSESTMVIGQSRTRRNCRCFSQTAMCASPS